MGLTEYAEYFLSLLDERDITSSSDEYQLIVINNLRILTTRHRDDHNDSDMIPTQLVDTI